LALVTTPNVRFGTFPAGGDPRLPAGVWSTETSAAGDASGDPHEFLVQLIPFTNPNQFRILWALTHLSLQKLDGSAPAVLVQTSGLTPNPFDTSLAVGWSRVMQTVADTDTRSKLQLRDAQSISAENPAILGYRVDGTAGAVVIRFPNTNGITDNIGLFGMFWLQAAAELPLGPQLSAESLQNVQSPNFGVGEQAFYSKLRRGESPVVPAREEPVIAGRVLPGTTREGRALAGAVASTAPDAELAVLRRAAQAPVGTTDAAIFARAGITQRVSGISNVAAISLQLGLGPLQVALQQLPAPGRKLAPGAAYANLTGRFEEGNGGI